MKDSLKPPSRLHPKMTWGPPARGPQSEALVWTSHDQKLPVGLLSTAPGQVLSHVGHRRPDLLHLHRWHLRVPEVSRLWPLSPACPGTGLAAPTPFQAGGPPPSPGPGEGLTRQPVQGRGGPQPILSWRWVASGVSTWPGAQSQALPWFGSLCPCPSPEHGAPPAPSTWSCRAGDLPAPQVGSWDGGSRGEAGLVRGGLGPGWDPSGPGCCS